MRTLLSFLLLLGTMPAIASDTAPTWLEDTLYGGGKMNAVVIVVAIIIAGIGLWLWRQDRKLTRLEERIRRSDDQMIK